MPAQAMKLVTIICETLARDAVTRLLRQVGARGFTVFPVEGEGAKGARLADIGEYANIQIEAVVPPAVAVELLARLEADYFPRYGMIAFESDVRVLRANKF